MTIMLILSIAIKRTTQRATDVYGLHWNYSYNNDHDTSKIVQSNDKSYIPIYLDIDCHYKQGKVFPF
jgi:hypothetical protein